jgi:hypothetical protein
MGTTGPSLSGEAIVKRVISCGFPLVVIQITSTLVTERIFYRAW